MVLQDARSCGAFDHEIVARPRPFARWLRKQLKN